MFDEVAGLEERGHEVAHFATAHPLNEPSPFDAYFAPYIELGEGADAGFTDSVKATWRMFSNRPAAKAFRSLLEGFGPDMVHIHGIHRQLSPSILFVARAAGVPVVQTLHDYHHICPSDDLLRAGKTPCMPTECTRLNYWPAVSNSCLGGSRARSMLSATETWFQRARRAYERTVSRFIAPSVFMADAMKAGGWDLPMDVVPNAVPLRDATRGTEVEEPYVLYAGRLAREKGVGIALDAAKMAGIRMVVAGDGPMSGELRARHPEAEFLGHTSGEEVESLLDRAHIAVVPSLWHENASMAVLEAMAQGVPVVATRMGGIPEQVRDGVEGILCEPGNVNQMANAFRRLSDDVRLASTMGAAGRKRIAEEFSPDRHMGLLLLSYEKALGRT